MILKLLLVGALALLPACTSIQTPPPLAETSWRVVSINGRTTPAQDNYRIHFRGNSIGGQFGCNHFGGDYRLTGDMLVTGAVGMTEMACGEPANSFEGWGLAIIQRPMRLAWDSTSRMTLSNEAGRIELTRSD